MEKFTARAGLNITELDGNMGYVFVPMDDASAQDIGKPDIEDWTIDQDYPGYAEVRTVASNLNLQYEAPWFDVVSVTTYRESEDEFGVELDLTPADFGSAVVASKFRNFTQEFRLQSSDHGDQDASLDWTVGWFRNELERNRVLTFAGVGLMGGTLNGVSDAVFGQATYRLFDNALGLTAGGRYETTERKFTESVRGYDDTDKDDSQFLPKFAVDYRFTEDIMAYASATMGWRNGGVNPSTSKGQEYLKYDKETNWTYELGFKSRLLDNTLLFNAAVFHSVFEDYQDEVRPTPLVNYLSNVEEVTMDGFEIEVAWYPVRELELTASLGYVDAEYGDFPDATHGNLEGNTVQGVPDIDVNLAAKYTFLEHWYVRPEFVRTGKIYWDRANTKSQEGYWQTNLRLGWAKDNWEVYVFGDNLTNEYAFSCTADYLGTGNYLGSPISPLEVGLGVIWNY